MIEHNSWWQQVLSVLFGRFDVKRRLRAWWFALTVRLRRAIATKKQYDRTDNISLVGAAYGCASAQPEKTHSPNGNPLNPVLARVNPLRSTPLEGSPESPATNRGRRLSIWMVNHYATFPSKDQRGGRHFSLAGYLNANGWDTSIIASGTTHPSGERRLPWWPLYKAGTEEGVRFLWIGTPGYRSTGASRILNMVAFSMSLIIPGRTRSLPKPDLIIGSTVHPFAALTAMRLARRYAVPFVFEIRDVWPETLVDFGHWRADGLPARLTARLMKHLITRSCMVISPLAGVSMYLNEMGETEKRFLWISNGTAGALDAPINEPSTTPFTFMYFGSHGTANVLDRVIDAFDLFLRQHPGTQARLRLVGDGPLKKKLMARAAECSSAGQIEFLSRMPRNEVLDLSAEAHCLVAAMGDYPVYRFGVSMNKLYDYMLASRPIILACPVLDNPVALADAGMALQSAHPGDIADAMASVYNLTAEQRTRLGGNARRYVLANFSYEALALRLSAELLSVLGHRSPSCGVAE